MLVYFKDLSYFLVPQNVLSTSQIFPAQSTTSSRRLGSFYCRMVFRNQDLGSKCTYCYRVFITFKSSQCSMYCEDMCRYTNLCIHTHYIYFCIYLSVCIYIENISKYTVQNES